MAFGLTIGTERATALQNAIQDELLKRGLSSDPDPVMAEYITIMIINNKTPAQISSELEDLVAAEFDPSFVDWLFAEAAKGAPESEAPAPAEPSTSAHPPARDSPPHQPVDAQRRPPNGPRAGAPIYQQALSQAVPSTSPSAQKRTASARSPSPNGHPNKSRRMDLPTGPRAMYRDGPGGHGPGGNSRSLLDRVGPARGGHPPFNPHDDVQARIDSITNGSPDPSMMMMNGGFPMNGMPGMDMGAMGMAANPIMLQELMMNQMAMMSQIAGAMGILPQGQFMPGGFPMQPGMGGDMGGFGGPPPGGPEGGHRGRGRGRGGPQRGSSRGRGGHIGHHGQDAPTGEGFSAPGAATQQGPAPAPPTPAKSSPAIAAPTPITPSTSTGSGRAGFVPPERPQSPTLCKFALKCTNPLCRYSHPSPVATAESGVVLSNDACEKGKDCKDKDCIKAHVSPAVLNPNAEVPKPKPSTFVSPAPAAQQNAVQCRYGAGCTRPGCTYAHPGRQPAGHFAQPCRYGTACTRAACPFQHPEGRVLPTTFHRGLATTGGLVNVPQPETGSMGAPSPHKSVSFNSNHSSSKKADGAAPAANGGGAGGGAARSPSTNGEGANGSAADLEKKVKEMEERKNEAQKAIAAAQAGKKDDASKAVPISA